MKVKVARWGNSLGLRLPKAAVEAIGLKAGTEVEVNVEGRDLRVRASRPVPRYRLEDLLGQIDQLGPHAGADTVNWGPDIGSEIIEDAYSRREITLDDILSGRPRGGRKTAPRR